MCSHRVRWRGRLLARSSNSRVISGHLIAGMCRIRRSTSGKGAWLQCKLSPGPLTDRDQGDTPKNQEADRGGWGQFQPPRVPSEAALVSLTMRRCSSAPLRSCPTAVPSRKKPRFRIFPALNIRQAHERPEGKEEAAVMMVGLDPRRVLPALSLIEQPPRQADRLLRQVADYSMPNVSVKWSGRS